MTDKQQLCNSFYDIGNLVTISVTMPPADWVKLKDAEPRGWRCNAGYQGSRYDWFRTTSVDFAGSAFPAGAVHSFPSVGIRKKSYCGSFSTTKPSLNLDFSKYTAENEDAAENLIGTKDLTLNNSIQDPSYIRQPLGYTLFRQAGLPYCRCNFAKLYVNNNYMGVYVNLEPVKKRYLQNNFKNNDKGNLYELEIGEDLDKATMDADRLSFEGYSKFSDKKDLALAVAQIQNNGLAGMKQVIDLPLFIRLFAMDFLLKNWDGYTDNRNNTFLYNDVAAVANPTVNDVKFKLIAIGIDQILQEGLDFQLDDDSVLGKIVRNDATTLSQLKAEIRNLATTIFDRNNYDNVLTPFINQMETVLTGAGVAGVSVPIDVVKKQLRLVKSGAFQFLGEFPADSAFLRARPTDECLHASATEPVGAGFEAYHHQPTPSRSDLWDIQSSATHPGTCEIKNKKFGNYLHCSATHVTPKGSPNVCVCTKHPHDGNFYYPERVDCVDQWEVSGYFRLKNFRTGRYIFFSDTDLTPMGKKEVHQVNDVASATTLYLF